MEDWPVYKRSDERYAVLSREVESGDKTVATPERTGNVLVFLPALSGFCGKSPGKDVSRDRMKVLFRVGIGKRVRARERVGPGIDRPFRFRARDATVRPAQRRSFPDVSTCVSLKKGTTVTQKPSGRES